MEGWEQQKARRSSHSRLTAPLIKHTAYTLNTINGPPLTEFKNRISKRSTFIPRSLTIKLSFNQSQAALELVPAAYYKRAIHVYIWKLPDISGFSIYLMQLILNKSFRTSRRTITGPDSGNNSHQIWPTSDGNIGSLAYWYIYEGIIIVVGGPGKSLISYFPLTTIKCFPLYGAIFLGTLAIRTRIFYSK